MTGVRAHIPRRDPAQVMRLSRLGSLHQCRLSFMRQLTRRMAQEGWRFTRPVFDIDAKGVGHAVYSAQGPERAYSLVAFARWRAGRPRVRVAGRLTRRKTVGEILSQPEHLSLSLVDGQGRTLRQLSPSRRFAPGEHFLEYQLDQLGAGFYWLAIDTGKGIEYLKILAQP